MIEIVSTESGEPTLKVDRRFVHSRRNPATEARRFLESELGNKSCRTVLIVGAGLGYLTREARRAAPDCRTIAIHLSPISHASAVTPADAAWDPSASEGIETFLDESVAEEELSGLLTLFWRPALTAFPEEAQRVQTAVQEHISRLNASLATTGYFGPRWFRNGIVNYLNVSTWWKLGPVAAPVVVAAPGPSLDESVRAVREARSRVVLVAVASALHPLAQAGLAPDLVVHQDAGFYSGEHFRPLRTPAGRTAGSGAGSGDHLSGAPSPAAPPLAQPLSARPLPHLHRDGGQAIAWLQYDHPVDELLRHNTGAAAVSVPQLGTVTATAIRLALQITGEPVFLAGVDMASWDVLSHARGHIFDEYHAAVATRLHPLPTTQVARLAESATAPDATNAASAAGTGGAAGTPWRSTRDLSIYAAWFRSAAESHRMRRLAPSAVDLGIPVTQPEEFLRFPKPRAPIGPVGSPASVPPRGVRVEQLAGLLSSWSKCVAEFQPRSNAELAEAPSALLVLGRHLAMAEVLRTERAAPHGTEEVQALRDRLRATLQRAQTFLEMQRESNE